MTHRYTVHILHASGHDSAHSCGCMHELDCHMGPFCLQANLVSKIQSGHWIWVYDNVDIHRSTRHERQGEYYSNDILYIHVHVYTHALFSLEIDQVLLIMPTYHTIIPQQQAGLLSALCGSLAASWSRCTRLLQLWRRHGEARLRCRVAFAAWLSRPLCEFRTYISQPARSRELQRCFIVKLCPPLRKMVSTSRAKMYQAPPPLMLSIVPVKGHT